MKAEAQQGSIFGPFCFYCI